MIASWSSGFLSIATALALSNATHAQLGSVASERKISQTAGGFEGVLATEGRFGRSIAALGDINGDGIGDLAVGASEDRFSFNGVVWILFMNADGTVASEHAIRAVDDGFSIPSSNDLFGDAVAALGDLNGDGVGDLAVGAPSANAPFGDQGAVWILFLNTNGTVAARQRITDSRGGFTGDLRPGDNFGSSLATLGDLDGDGITDLAVGAFRDDDGASPFVDRGAVWILFLNTDGTVRSHQKISATAGGFGGILGGSDNFGSSVACLTDFDGNGAPVLAVGASGDDDGDIAQGAVWIVFLNSDGTVAAEQKISHAASFRHGYEFGFAVARVGDLDGNGAVELAVGPFRDNSGGDQQGAIWIMFLDTDGSVLAKRKISESGGGFGGALDPQDRFGSALANLGDFDGDGAPDLAAGAPWDDDGALDRGAVWMLFLEGDVCLDFETEEDLTTTLANGQDISTPPEFGSLVAITSSGPNAGAALFDSTPGGPNDPSQDRDLLIDSGNVLMLQTNDSTTQTVSGIFDRPNDDEDGGTLSFLFTAPVEPRHVDLVDIDSGSDEACQLILTDKAGRSRVFTIPPGWTGDLLVDGIGRRTLHLDSLDPQPGFAAVATAVEDANFAADRVLSLVVQLGSSGAIDDLCWRPIPKGIRPHPQAHPRSGSGVPPGARSIGVR